MIIVTGVTNSFELLLFEWVIEEIAEKLLISAAGVQYSCSSCRVQLTQLLAYRELFN